MAQPRIQNTPAPQVIASFEGAEPGRYLVDGFDADGTEAGPVVVVVEADGTQRRGSLVPTDEAYVETPHESTEAVRLPDLIEGGDESPSDELLADMARRAKDLVEAGIFANLEDALVALRANLDKEEAPSKPTAAERRAARGPRPPVSTRLRRDLFGSAGGLK